MKPTTIICSLFIFSHLVSSERTGYTGATGATGLRGQIGSRGYPGPRGRPGPPGTGWVGSTGATGRTGSTGATGMLGYMGSTGVPGRPGPGGRRGATGRPGANGVTGGTGATGPPGRRSLVGTAVYYYSKGATGPPGVIGATGQIGDTGAMGLQGPLGPPGLMGPPGPPGPPGRVINESDVSQTGEAEQIRNMIYKRWDQPWARALLSPRLFAVMLGWLVLLTICVIIAVVASTCCDRASEDKAVPVLPISDPGNRPGQSVHYENIGPAVEQRCESNNKYDELEVKDDSVYTIK